MGRLPTNSLDPPSTSPEAGGSVIIPFLGVSHWHKTLLLKSYMGPGENRGLPLSRCPISILKFLNPFSPEYTPSKHPFKVLILSHCNTC